MASDVESIDTIITATYDVISGPAGKKRDWDRMRSLFFPGGRLIPTAKEAGRDDVDLAPNILDVNGFIARAEPILEKERLLRKGNRAARRALWPPRACLEHV